MLFPLKSGLEFSFLMFCMRCTFPGLLFPFFMHHEHRPFSFSCLSFILPCHTFPGAGLFFLFSRCGTADLWSCSWRLFVLYLYEYHIHVSLATRPTTFTQPNTCYPSLDDCCLLVTNLYEDCIASLVHSFQFLIPLGHLQLESRKLE